MSPQHCCAEQSLHPLTREWSSNMKNDFVCLTNKSCATLDDNSPSQAFPLALAYSCKASIHAMHATHLLQIVVSLGDGTHNQGQLKLVLY